MSELIDLSGFRAEVSAIGERLDELQHQQRRTGTVDPLARAALAELQTTVEELQVSQEELAAQNEALIDSRRELEEGRDRYQLLFQSAVIPYIVTDARGIISQANRAAVELFNVDERFLLNKPVATFVVPAHRPAVRQRIVEITRGGAPTRDELDVQPRRRPPVPAQVDLAPLRGGTSGDALLWLIQDLTAERQLMGKSTRLTAELERLAGQEAAVEDDRLSPAVTFALDELRGLLLDEQPLETVMRRVAETGRIVVPTAAGVSVSLFEQGRARVIGSTAPWVESVDSRQYALQEGPCVAAMADGAWHTSDNLDEDPRWPRFATEATSQGVLSALAVPLLVRGARLGVLNIYGSNRAAFDGRAVTAAQRLAEVCAPLIANAQVLAASKRLAEELEQALVSRSTVDMAKGILMARLGVDSDTAFDALRDLSQRRHVKLRDLAAEIVRAPGE